MNKEEGKCCDPTSLTVLDVNSTVSQRYAAAAQQREPALCCPVQYRPDLLAVIPQEIIEKDYGCGDPSPFVNTGDTIVDLGSGGGKLCYIAAQLVGPSGRVIGVDCNLTMLELARKHQSTVAKKLGYSNVEFRCGMIQDLQLNLEKLAERIDHAKLVGVERILESRRIENELRETEPLIESSSVDCVVSNCVLNLVRPNDRRNLFQEIFRIVKPGGKVAISDIVSDKSIPDHLKADPVLWSGCLSGAWQEDEFLTEFKTAGFADAAIVKRQLEPWQTVEGIEFRSVTIVGHKNFANKKVQA